jgi:RNA-directed DNA polymerase
LILCKKGKADEALQQLRKIMSKLKLMVNEEKTRICKVPEGEFDFLGEVIQRDLELLGESDPFDCKSAS